VTSGNSAPDVAAGTPLPGVHVVAQNGQGDVVGYGITDDAGTYTIESLPAGQLSVVVDHEGYASSQGTIAIGTDGQPASADFTLQLATPTSVSNAGPTPMNYALEQNYPNPFNPSTRISFSIPIQSTVTLRIYNLLGQEVTTLINEMKTPGNYISFWNGKDNAGNIVASGLYFYRLQATSTTGGQEFVQMRKMVLLK
jgi:hypothetical protein